jgi:hypothetical protein
MRVGSEHKVPFVFGGTNLNFGGALTWAVRLGDISKWFGLLRFKRITTRGMAGNPVTLGLAPDPYSPRMAHLFFKD